MEQFFSQCGEFITCYTIVDGQFPQRTFTQRFVYTNMSAEYDGRKWKYFQH